MTSKLCTTCQNQSYSFSNSTTATYITPLADPIVLHNTDFTNCSTRYGQIAYTGSYVADSFYPRRVTGNKDDIVAKANATKLPFFYITGFAN